MSVARAAESLATRPFDGAAIERLKAALQSAEPPGNVITRPLAIGPARRGVPLLVVVHPGSLCGSYTPAPGRADVRFEIARLARDWRGDIALIVGDGDAAIDAPRNAGEEAIADLVDRAWSAGTTLLAPPFAEDIEAAAHWLIREMKADQRPYIKVTGAWADPGDGCATILAEALRRYCLNVMVPEFTPVMNATQAAPQSNVRLEPSWAAALKPELEAPYMAALRDFLRAEIAAGKTIYPEPRRFFAALDATPIDRVKAVILGQDPYHGPGQAIGMSFAVARGVHKPPSLQNIFKELHSDLGIAHPAHGDLSAWAEQGVLLLNSVLSVEAGKPASHAGRGWETFTDAIVATLNERRRNVVFILWGAYARKKGAAVDRSRHFVIESAHPSPYAAANGFFGSKPFSRANAYLREHGVSEIDWRID